MGGRKDEFECRGEIQNGTLQGTITEPDGKTHRFKGVRAPELKRTAVVKWGNQFSFLMERIFRVGKLRVKQTNGL
ncbi:hypothetical protein KUH03_25615 [Sphingobacterium sp. E70]|uniref:hypothetical protein n=1 Tax=Sphingobacterium sp. E70 TaxID=2853439 RepID=UPI00211B7EA7|nr:hypothetical protein [Sphingobacterium sp. E70]ULT29214.1 hypothetical protein KUH03_25615 [Sphingobacterium sp. E70]